MSTTLDTQPPRIDLIVPRNAVQPFTITVANNGAAVDLSARELVFVVKAAAADLDDDALLLKDSAGRGGIVVTNAAAGQALLTLAGGDCANTALFPAGMARVWALKLYSDDVTLASGQFIVVDTVIAANAAF